MPPSQNISLLSMRAPLRVPTTACSPGQRRQRAQAGEARFRERRAATNPSAGREAARAPRPHGLDPPPPSCASQPYLELGLSVRRLGRCALARMCRLQPQLRRPAQASLYRLTKTHFRSSSTDPPFSALIGLSRLYSGDLPV